MPVALQRALLLIPDPGGGGHGGSGTQAEVLATEIVAGEAMTSKARRRTDGRHRVRKAHRDGPRAHGEGASTSYGFVVKVRELVDAGGGAWTEQGAGLALALARVARPLVDVPVLDDHIRMN